MEFYNKTKNKAQIIFSGYKNLSCLAKEMQYFLFLLKAYKPIGEFIVT
jgi:hypothetical protein